MTNLSGLDYLEPADWAERLERLPTENARELLNKLPAAEVAATLSELSPKEAAQLLDSFTNEKVIPWLQLMSPNAVADLAGEWRTARREEILAALPCERN